MTTFTISSVMNLKRWFSLENSVVALAGASGLLGQECLTALRECGAKTVGIDQNHFQGADESIIGDISSPEIISRIFSSIQALMPSKNGCIGIVNASYPRTPNWGQLGFENVTNEDWNRNFEIHLGSTFQICRESVRFAKRFESSNFELRILNFASIYALVGPNLSIYEGTSIQNPAPYAAIKAGVIGLTRYIATTEAKNGVKANVICPGGIENLQNHSFIKKYSALTPMGRMGTPTDIAGVVAMLMGPSAAYINGQVIAIDGGWTAW